MAYLQNPLDPQKRWMINPDGTPSEVPADLPVADLNIPPPPQPSQAAAPAEDEPVVGAGTRLAVEQPQAAPQPQMPAPTGGVDTGILGQLRNRSVNALGRLDQANAEIDNFLSKSGGPIEVQAKAADELAKIAVAEQRAKDAADREKLEADQRYIANSQRMSDIARIKTETAMADAANMDQQYREAKIDPSRFWTNKSTGSKILAGIGIALGALGQTLTGRPNGAIEIFNQAIEEDIAAQKEQLSRLRDSSQTRLNDIGRYRQKLNDDMAAELLAKSNAWAKVEKAYSEQLALINPQKVTQEQLAQKAQLQQKSAEAARQAAEEHYKKELEVAKQGAAIEKDRLDLGLRSNEQRAKDGASSGSVVMKPVAGTAPSKEDTDKAKALYAKVAPALSDVDRLAALVKKMSTGDKITMTSADAQEAKIIARKMPYQIAAALGQGAINKEQEAAFSEMVANPAAFDFTGRGPALIQGLKNNIEANVNQTLRGYNMELAGSQEANPSKWQAE